MTTRAKKLRTIGDLILDDKNANRGTDRGRNLVGHSLELYGAGRSVLADRRGKLIAGNKTVERAAQLGKKIIVVPTRGDELVVVQRTDLDMDQDPAARELAIADNRSSEVGLDWDEAMLDELHREGVDLSFFFTDAELDKIIGDQGGGDLQDSNVGLERAAALQKKWRVKPGELWTIGPHRLLCGDATSAADVGRLLGAQRPALMITDPPYGVNFDAMWRVKFDGHQRKSTAPIKNDDAANWRVAFELSPSAVAYVWHGDKAVNQVATDLAATGFEIRNQIVWRKSQFVFSRGHYHHQHELCWYAVRKNQRSGWTGDHAQSTVWDIGHQDGGDEKPASATTGHGNQKPLECMTRPLRNHAGDVYDPFVGSGTTIVAAQNLDRKCFALDIDPAFVAVTLERMTTAFPGLQTSREGGAARARRKVAA